MPFPAPLPFGPLSPPTLSAGRRMLHPVAWWLWGLGLATAAAHTTNPLLLLLVLAVAGWVVLERREVGAVNPFLPFLVIGLAAIGIRVVLTAFLGNGVQGRIVLARLPEVPLPAWAAGVHVGGLITAEALVAAGADGLRLAATLACVGAANALASPRRLLRYVPATLYDVGTAIVVALTYAPQMVADARRVRQGRRLRGHSGRGLGELGRLSIPVIEGSLDRSLQLAASMESRGYGRMPVRSPSGRWLGSGLTLVGLLGVVAGLYGVLDASTPGLLGLPMLLAGVVVAGLALVAGARRETRSTYRRDPWSWPEWLVVAVGAIAGASLIRAESQGWPGVVMPQVPLEPPAVSPLLVCAVLLAGLPAVLTPVPPRLALRRATPRTTAETGAQG